MKRTFWILCICLLVSKFLYADDTVLESTAEGFDVYAVEIAADRVNLRIGPGTEHSIVGQVNKGVFLVVVGKQEDWIKIRWPYDIGIWVSKGYVGKDLNGKDVITGNNVNVRIKPGINYPIITKLNKGDKLSIIERSGDWVSIEPFSDLACWIYGKYVKGSIGLDEFYENEHSRQARAQYEVLQEEYDKYLTGDTSIDLKAIKNKFIDIAMYYPKTTWAKLALEKTRDIEARIAWGLSSVQRKKDKPSTAKTRTRKNLSKRDKSLKNKGLQEFSGVIKDVGVIGGRKSGFKLASKDGKVYYLISKSVNLADYPYGKVRIFGDLSKSKGDEIPLIEVVDIQWLYE